jgi:hypothetical protein
MMAKNRWYKYSLVSVLPPEFPSKGTGGKSAIQAACRSAKETREVPFVPFPSSIYTKTGSAGAAGGAFSDSPRREALRERARVRLRLRPDLLRLRECDFSLLSSDMRS